MKWKILGLLILAGAGWTGMASAQSAGIQAYPGGHRLAPVNEKSGTNSEPPRLLYEEIEILRRLLNRRLSSLAGGGPAGINLGSVALPPDGKVPASGELGVRLWVPDTGKMVHGFKELSGPEGVYLKGYGIVYAATLPLHFQQPISDPSHPATPPPTEWDRMRREVRGEKPEPEKPGGRPDETIADALLKLLAENGRHLTQLGENERVTVALTLVSGQACAQCHGPTMTGRGTEPWLLYLGNVGIGQGQSGLTVLDATGTVSTPPWAVRQPVPVVGQPAGLKDAEQKIAGFKADAHKSALLGDLRAKDGQIDQAVEAYQKALAAYSAALETQRRASLDVTGLPSPRDVAVELEIMELKTKLAQLYLAQGKTEQAQQAIQSLANSAQRTAQAEALSKAGSGQGREPLPPRLVMSVSKKLLDQVGSGQSTFEEFRKAATVQYLKFDEPGPAPTKP